MALYSLGLAHLLVVATCLGQCGVAIAAIVIVRERLWWWVSNFHGWSEVCLMTEEGESVNLCSYAYWVVGLSFFLSIALMFAQCFIRERKSYLLSTVGMSLLGSVWWLAFSITATVYGVRANEANEEQESSRNAVFILGWVNTLLFLVCMTLGILVMTGHMRGAEQRPAPQPYPPGPVGYQPGPYVAQGYPAPGYPQQGYSYPYPPPPPYSQYQSPPGYPPPQQCEAPPRQFASAP